MEAAETVIWLTEVAGILQASGNARRGYETIGNHLIGANHHANSELFRMALKLATGAGKTTVMAMLIAWQTVNAIRYPRRDRFAKRFLIVTPGITIRDRLRALVPNDPENYYEYRDLVPKDMLTVVKQAQVVITNFHAFQLREKDKASPRQPPAAPGQRRASPQHPGNGMGHAPSGDARVHANEKRSCYERRRSSLLP